MINCPFCNQKIKDEDFEEHLCSYHFLSYPLYYEIVSQSFSESCCWKCGKPRIPLTPFSKNYYLPCFDCFGNSSVIELLESFLKKFEGNKYLQYYLSDETLPEKVFPHTIEDFSSVIEELRSGYGRITNPVYFEIVRKNNYTPFEVSMRNFSNLHLETYNGILGGEYIILSGEKYKVIPPESCEYNSKHHTRYSILNTQSTKVTKKIKLGDKSCYKLWGKSIFLLKNSNDEVVSPEDLDESDLIILKNYIFRKKVFFTLIEKIYLEICKFSNILNDEVFIKNTIPLSTNSSVNVFQFSWLPQEPKEFFKTNSIVNLSIL
jgi:hypothetical protein